MRKFLLWPALIATGAISLVVTIVAAPFLAVLRSDKRERDTCDHYDRDRWVGYDDDDLGDDIDEERAL